MIRQATQYEKYQKNRKMKTFLKMAIICAVLIQIAVIGGIFVANSFIRPPDIPLAETIPVHAPIRVTSNPVPAIAPVTEPEEFTGFDSYIVPLVDEYTERKPMFFTFLIFGLTEGLNANTIMVAAYDADSGRGYVISIPRDTRVDAQRNNRKIVAAYNVGRRNGGGHEGGVERLKYEVQTLLGFRPDYYVSIDYEAFIRVVDAVGGVEVYVPFHMLYDDPYQDLHIDIKPGLQTLDGEDALRFARYRRGNDPRQNITDYQRIEHQHQIISSIFQALLTPRTILRIPEFFNIFNNHLATDLSYGELMWFANQGRSIITSADSDSLQFHTIPMLGTSGAPHWYELADEAGIIELVNRTVNPFKRDITAADLRIVR